VISKHQAEQVTGPVEWINDCEGFLPCPGHDLHGNKSGRRDCKVYLDKVPTIYCVHQSCADPVAKLNRELRRAVSGSTSMKLTLGGVVLSKSIAATPQTVAPKSRREYLQRRSRERQLEAAARKQLERILIDPLLAWNPDQILADSPMAPGEEPREDWLLFLALFDGMEGELWCGETYDSGEEKHRENFRSIEQWSLVDQPPAPFTCSGLFRPNTVSRSNRNVSSRPYMVMESDALSKGQMGAVLRWFNKVAHWPLRAVIDTGGKSLHGWFDMPPQEWLPDLQVILEAMKLDPAMLKPSQPARLPGYPRDNTHQRLVYYAPPVKSI